MKLLVAVLAVLAVAGPALADDVLDTDGKAIQREDGPRTERVNLVDGIKLYSEATTTTNFGGVMKHEPFQGAGDGAAGESGDAGAAAGDSAGSTGGDSGGNGEGCSR